MEKVRVLVVEDDIQQRRSAVDFLRTQQDIEVVGEAAEGQAALLLMAQEKPDVVLLDMVMQGMDGWETLRQMQIQGMDLAKVIVVTAIHTEHHIMRASEYGVGSYMLKPFYDLRMLYQRILDVAHGFAAPKPESYVPQAKRFVPVQEDEGSLLLALGVPAHVKGFLYLREAIRRTTEDNTLMSRLTTELYPEIAQRFDTTSTNVERAMRNAIKICYSRITQERLDAVLGPGIGNANYRPSCGEFIALLVNRQQLRKTGA